MTYEGDQKREYQRKWLAARRQKAIAYLGGECVDCGDTNKLEFDHDDPFFKSQPIANLLSGRWDRLLVELKKCVLRCEFCHQVKTSHEKMIVHNKGCTCDSCKANRAAKMRAYRQGVYV